MKELGATLNAELGDAARRVPTRSSPNLVLRLVSRFKPEFRPFLPNLGYAKKTSNDKARLVQAWTPRDPHEALVAAGMSMDRKGLLRASSKGPR